MTDSTREPIVTISWCPLDLMEEYGYSEEKATEVLESIASALEDRSIELGWQVIEMLIDENEAEEILNEAKKPCNHTTLYENPDWENLVCFECGKHLNNEEEEG